MSVEAEKVKILAGITAPQVLPAAGCSGINKLAYALIQTILVKRIVANANCNVQPAAAACSLRPQLVNATVLSKRKILYLMVDVFHGRIGPHQDDKLISHTHTHSNYTTLERGQAIYIYKSALFSTRD